MSQALFLDTTPLGLAAQRLGHSAEGDSVLQWIRELLICGWTVYIPEIADFEVRRELKRSGKLAGLQRLDALQEILTYLPLNTSAMRLAADLWADARNKGWATADPKALDGDVILAAQALSMPLSDATIIVATENAQHLSRYVNAKTWRSIFPV